MPPTAVLTNPSDYDLNVRLAELRGWTFEVCNDPDNYFGIAYRSMPPGDDCGVGRIAKLKQPPDFVAQRGRLEVMAEISSHGVRIIADPKAV